MSPRKINRISLLLLIVGFTCAIAIYFTATPVEIDPLLGEPLANRKYLRELRVIGGKANVAAAEFQEWFAGLWHGESLAGTVAVLTVATTLAFRFLATHPAIPADRAESEISPPDTDRESGATRKRD